MKKIFLICFFLIMSCASFAQASNYQELADKADSLYRAGNFLLSAQTYSEAFKSSGWKGYIGDRYNAACSWALVNIADSAFYQLFRIADKAKFDELEMLTSDTDLISLHSDPRWTELTGIVSANKDSAEAKMDKVLAGRLDSIREADQMYRNQINLVQSKYGYESDEMKSLIRKMIETDSINLIKVVDILETRGWLGSDVLGVEGNSTLFLVIQHANLAVQEKYLPMMRDAVKDGRANAGELAMLEDRVALRKGKMQIYGSQIGMDSDKHTYYVSALEDPDHVDERRSAVGLGPLSEYVSQWGIEWNVEEYKKDLPNLISKLKK